MTLYEAIKILRQHNITGASVQRITNGRALEKDLLAQVLNACESLMTEKTEYKRLLKAAVEDIHELLCDKKNLDGNGQSCNICSYIKWCPCCKECTIRADLRNWRYADEALKLIGDEPNGI
jgi:hypothetical protein